MSGAFQAALHRAGIVRPWRPLTSTPPAHSGRPLIWSLDNFQWDPRTLAQVEADIRQHRPLWIRIANFYPRITQLLARLGDQRLNVLWKQEFCGYDSANGPLLAASGIDPALYVSQMASSGHNVVPYTFDEWNHSQISMLMPGQSPLHILPVAAKPPLGDVRQLRRATREAFGIPSQATVFGVGGLLHPEKGIEHMVQVFLETNTKDEEHLLCALVVDWDDDTESIRARWRHLFGADGMERLHIRVGGYGDWHWMNQFYATCDYVLVNSRRDSAPRMVSEPVSCGIPVVATASNCGTNHLIPGLVIADSIVDFTSAAFRLALARARQVAPTLAWQHVDRNSLRAVREAYLTLLIREADPCEHDLVQTSARDPASLAILDELMVF